MSKPISNYHGRIMNIQLGISAPRGTAFNFYELGHRDARHMAARIALEAEQEISQLMEEREKLREALEQLAYSENWGISEGYYEHGLPLWEDKNSAPQEIAKAALASLEKSNG